MSEDRLTIQDCQEVHFCVPGAIEFFKSHDLDWRDFIRNGIEISKIEALNDYMADQVVAFARARIARENEEANGR
jgi:hypothetical protein